MTRKQATELIETIGHGETYRHPLDGVTVFVERRSDRYYMVRRGWGGVVIAHSAERAALYLQQAVNRAGAWKVHP